MRGDLFLAHSGVECIEFFAGCRWAHSLHLETICTPWLIASLAFGASSGVLNPPCT